MRFYRAIFWFFALAHFALGLWFCFAPSTVKTALDQFATTPLIFTQSQGLFFWILASGFAYCAENPEHAIPVVAIMTLMKLLMPLFTYVGLTNTELSPTHFHFELALDLSSLPFLISYFFWYYHKPRPDRFSWMIGLFGKSK